MAGLPTRVAFAVTDIDGRPMDTEGELLLADGKVVAVNTLREGRGVFDYTPSQEPATLILSGKDGRRREFVLPEASKDGCVMSVDATDGDYINVVVRRSDGFAGAFGTCAGQRRQCGCHRHYRPNGAHGPPPIL